MTTITINDISYEAQNLGVGENTRRAGVAGQWGIKGPRGAYYFLSKFDDGTYRTLSMRGNRVAAYLPHEVVISEAV